MPAPTAVVVHAAATSTAACVVGRCGELWLAAGAPHGDGDFGGT
jgi:hypothetical protein